MDIMEYMREYNDYMRDTDTAQKSREREVENMKKLAGMAIAWGERI